MKFAMPGQISKHQTQRFSLLKFKLALNKTRKQSSFLNPSSFCSPCPLSARRCLKIGNHFLPSISSAISFLPRVELLDLQTSQCSCCGLIMKKIPPFYTAASMYFFWTVWRASDKDMQCIANLEQRRFSHRSTTTQVPDLH